MDQFRPHLPSPTFEGYYSKFKLPSGAHLALIICSVPKANHKPHMVSFTYVPPGFPQTPCFQREVWVESIEMVDLIQSHSHTDTNEPSPVFELRIPDMGTMKVYTDDTTTYDITDPKGTFRFTAHIPGSTRTPWSRNKRNSTPEGLLVHLPLPLHWHVHSVNSTCSLTLTIPSSTYTHLHPLDSPPQLPAQVHQEKNWAHSFPKSHIWIQARNSTMTSGLNIAGGSILGVEAYLVSYHAANAAHDTTFTPPYAVAPSLPFLPNTSPSMSASHCWRTRTVSLSISSVTRKIEISAHAPAGTFVGYSAPFFDGHRENFLAQSFRAVAHVRVYAATRAGFGHWELLCEETFEGVALEFGGDAYASVDKGRDTVENAGEPWVC